MKHSLRFSLIAVLLLFCMGRTGYSQTSYEGLLQYQFPMLSTYPPLSLGMSFDVLEAYIGADSICRSLPVDNVNPLQWSMGYSDTLKEAARYMYEADDYDPVQFFQWKYTDPTHRYTIPPGIPGAWPGAIVNAVNADIQRLFPDTGETGYLCEVDYIADVTVTATYEGYDSSAVGAHNSVKVTCTVLDPIKGQVLPTCIPDPPSPSNGALKNKKYKTANATGGCLQFEYSLEWNRMSNLLSMSDTNSLGSADGRRWVQLDSEYIIFPEFLYTGGGTLGTLGGGTDVSHVYACFLPARWFGHSCGIYPVRGGIVYDPYNDFGFGTGLTVSQWKTALRNKIYSITHP